MRGSVGIGCVVLALGACSGGDGGATALTSPGTLTLTISSADAMTSVGDQRTVSGDVRDADGHVVAFPEIAWSTSASGVATVAGAGAAAVVTAVDDGTATITASVATPNGTLRASADVTVRRRLASLAFPAESLWVDMGTTVPLRVIGRDARGHPLAALDATTFVSRDSALAFVAADGTLATVLPRRANFVVVTARRQGVTVTDSLVVGVNVPLKFDFASLILSDYEVPARVPTPAMGLAYFIRDGSAIRYVLGWSALSGQATTVHVHGPATTTQVGDVLVDVAPVAQGGGYGLATGTITAADIRAAGGAPPITLDSLLTLMRARAAYVDVHTVAYPLGEARGVIEGPFR
jgi:hypothetical protein